MSSGPRFLPSMPRPTISPDLQRPHVSRDPMRGYVEHDPIVRVGPRGIERGQHGLMDIRAEIARTAHDAGMIDDQIIRDILKRRS